MSPHLEENISHFVGRTVVDDEMAPLDSKTSAGTVVIKAMYIECFM